MARDAGGHCGSAARRCLCERHPPTLAGRCARDDPSAAVQVDELGVGDAAREVHPVTAIDVADDLVERRALVALADDRELDVGPTPAGHGDRSDEVFVALDRY